jgi:hypothetical protein
MMRTREDVLSVINGAWATQAIGAACELGLPDLLAGTGKTQPPSPQPPAATPMPSRG